MTREEAILRIQDHIETHHIGERNGIYLHEALTMAMDALRQQEEIENKPLTMAELREMNGETVYCLELNTDVKISAPQIGIINISYSIPGEWGTYKAKGMTLYRNKPKEN